jgi:hypothetical protein
VDKPKNMEEQHGRGHYGHRPRVGSCVWLTHPEEVLLLGKG